MDTNETLWRECLTALNIESGTLLHQSTLDPFRRTYLANGYIYKVVALQHEITSNLRAQDLAGEFCILKHCAGIPGVPSAVAHHKTDEFEVLVIKQHPGEPLTNLTIDWLRLFIILANLGVILLRLSWRGISHNDIKPDNIIIASDNSVSLIDFDQSCRVSSPAAIAKQFFGINMGISKVHSSILSILKKKLRQSMPPKAVKLLMRLRSRKAIEKLRTLPVLPDDASSQLKTLLKAWEIAQESDANAPGQQLAYYSLSLEGYQFPGERPWIERWNMLRSITDYSRKRILELGCNMGLLSCFLLKNSHAIAILAVDADPDIIEAAKLVSLAFDVKPIFRQQNFDDPYDWEKELSDFKPDIVFALNVLNWVQDKQRLINFLGRFHELIFEGHDSIAIEKRRFRGVGFKRIEVVGFSERGREVIHCQK